MNKNVLLLSVVFWLVFSTCNVSKKLIIKEWKLSKMELATDFTSSPKHMEVFKNFEEKAQFVFNKDGTYFFDLVNETQKGKWEIKEKGKMLVTVTDSGIQFINTIIELTDNKLVIKNESDPSPATLFLIPKL